VATLQLLGGEDGHRHYTPGAVPRHNRPPLPAISTRFTGPDLNPAKFVENIRFGGVFGRRRVRRAAGPTQDFVIDLQAVSAEPAEEPDRRRGLGWAFGHDMHHTNSATRTIGGPPANRTTTLAIAAALLAGTANVHPAAADLKLCNMTPSRVGVAVGYKDKNSGQWVTEGWWNVLSHSCETLITGELQGRFYYVHAVDYDRGGAWSGKDKLCVDDKTFTINGIGDCQQRGHQTAGFSEVDTGDAKDYTIRLIDPGESGDKTQ
jgi:uncharacterized membrane protein